ncbi:iojap-like protein [Halothece sp. PCC 7418]|uniref:ribosome silencing factor n=1 Tax=Halothece sp. (strain PCC 7418) TaxID=65093 RepID=UPI0002A05B25|nr:ribosome silencing factor [Halothece sp. PCC 7418]AFZ44115.1 iojap-like protein [Halothece sp. PCC 7418]
MNHQPNSNPTSPNTPTLAAAETLAWTIAHAADSRKAGDIVLLEVVDVSYLADYFVISTGYSRTQVKAISDAIQDTVEQQFNAAPVRTEGQKERNWILLDYGDVIAHILLPEEREFYGIEAFWGHAKRIDFETVQQAEAG